MHIPANAPSQAEVVSVSLDRPIKLSFPILLPVRNIAGHSRGTGKKSRRHRKHEAQTAWWKDELDASNIQADGNDSDTESNTKENKNPVMQVTHRRGIGNTS